MTGNISISDFIHKVKQELLEAQRPTGEPFYTLTEVKLEVSFVLNSSAKAGLDLYVVDLSGEAKAEQTHKVTLSLVPIGALIDSTPTKLQASHSDVPSSGVAGGGGGGGEGIWRRSAINYGPHQD